METDRYMDEIGLIGGLLSAGDPISIRTAQALVGPEHFSDTTNALTFAKIIEAVDTGLSRYDLTKRVSVDLRGCEALKEVNMQPSAFVAHCIASASPAIALESTAIQIRIDWLQDELKKAVNLDDPDHAGKISTEISRLRKSGSSRGGSGLTALSSGGDEVLQRISDMFKGDYKPNIGASCGLTDLTNLFGGWRPGKYYVIGGRPGMGKTTATLSWMISSARKGANILMYSLEMTAIELTEMALCNLAWSASQRIEYRDIAGTSTDTTGMSWKFEALRDAQDALKQLPFTITDRPGLTIAEIRAQAIQEDQRLRALGRKLDVVVIDHLGLIKASSRYSGNKVAETEELSAALKILAKELNVAVICLVQLNRGVEGRDDKQPSLSDLRWSGAIEQDADVVGFVYREAYYLQKTDPDRLKDEERRMKLATLKDKIQLIVAKHRGGPTPTLSFFCDIGCGVVRDAVR